GILATVSQLNTLRGVGLRLGDVTQGQREFAEVASSYGRVLPILTRDGCLQSRLHGPHRLAQPTQHPEAKAGVIQEKGLVTCCQRGERSAPGQSKELGHSREVRAIYA